MQTKKDYGYWYSFVAPVSSEASFLYLWGVGKIPGNGFLPCCLFRSLLVRPRGGSRCFLPPAKLFSVTNWIGTPSSPRCSWINSFTAFFGQLPLPPSLRLEGLWLFVVFVSRTNSRQSYLFEVGRFLFPHGWFGYPRPPSSIHFPGPSNPPFSLTLCFFVLLVSVFSKNDSEEKVTKRLRHSRLRFGNLVHHRILTLLGWIEFARVLNCSPKPFFKASAIRRKLFPQRFFPRA